MRFVEPTYNIVSPDAAALSGSERKRHLAEYQTNLEQLASRPAAPSFVRVTDRQGGVFVQIEPVKGADGYEITVSSDKAGENVQRKEFWRGEFNTEGFVSLGNTNISEAAVLVQAIRGNRRSKPFAQAACGKLSLSGSSTAIDPATPETPTENLPIRRPPLQLDEPPQ